MKKNMSYACDRCAKKYTDRSNLQRHKRIAHLGNRYVCETCGKHFTRKFKLASHKCVTKKDAMEQEQLEEETGPPPKQRRKTTVTSQSKAVEEGEINCGLEMTKEDTLKQFEELEKDAQVNKKFKQTIKEHATDKEMLARDDEADTFHSLEAWLIIIGRV